MNDRIAVLLVNYNMPERTDALCRHLLEFVQWPLSLFVVDNGSDLCKPSQYTTTRLPHNVQTTRGWLAGLEEAQQAGPWLGYLFLITSTEFLPGIDPISPLAKLMLSDPEIAGIHPSLTRDSTSDWPHLFGIWGNIEPRRTWHIDNICSLWRADWFDSIGGFNPDLTYAWGIDLELSWMARRDGKKLMVHDGRHVKKVTDIGYTMERMNMTAQQRRENASHEMACVLSAKYGSEWWRRMTGEYVSDEMLMPAPYLAKERVTLYANFQPA